MYFSRLFLLFMIAFSAKLGICTASGFSFTSLANSVTFSSNDSSEYILINLTEAAPAKAKRLANLNITHKEFPNGCTYQEVLAFARNSTLKAGGNAFKITVHKSPDAKSTCHQISGTILKLTSEQILKYKNSNLKELEKVIARQKFLDDSLVSSLGNAAVHSKVSKVGQFPGGDAALLNFISNTVKYPATAKKDKIVGLNVASFVVDTDGSISNIQIIHSLRQDFDNETIRVIQAMPRWNPATLNGQIVRSRFYLPVRYSIGKSN